MTSASPHLSGEGRVFNSDTLLATAHYEIRLRSTFSESNLLDGGRSVTPTGVQLESLHLSSLSAPIPVSADRLTLVLEDGRKLDFVTRSANTFVSTGSFYK